MAEKDRELIIAYFPAADEAQAAGEQLKDWDKERKDIKLGAISIMTMDDKAFDKASTARRSSHTNEKYAFSGHF